jgi:hypothetical protein
LPEISDIFRNTEGSDGKYQIVAESEFANLLLRRWKKENNNKNKLEEDNENEPVDRC